MNKGKGGEVEVKVKGPSLPSNYVTIHHLKDRWLQQQKQLQIPPPQSNPNRLPPRRTRPNRRRFVKNDSDSGVKTQIDVVDNHPKGRHNEKKEHSNLPNKKSSCRGPKPNPNGDGIKLEQVRDKLQTRQLGVRHNRNQIGVWEPKDKMAPVAHNDGGNVAIAAQTVSEGKNRKRFYEKPQVKPKPKPKPKPLSGVKKGQTAFVWVKKGESPAN